MSEVAADRDKTERVRLIASACSRAQRPDPYLYRGAVGDHRAELAELSVAMRHLPDRYLSHKCADGRWHTGCAGVGAAWDFILDRAVHCDCQCHQESARP